MSSILVPIESACKYSYWWSIATSNLDRILHRLRNTAAQMAKIDNFPYPGYPTPIPAKGVPFGVDP